MFSKTIRIDGIIGDDDLTAASIQKKILATHEEKMRVVLSIDSEGGSVDDVIDIVAFCRYLGLPFDTCATGKVSSAAFLLFCYGEKRLTAESAEFLYHKPSHYIHRLDDHWAEINQCFEFRESAIINMAMRRILECQVESDTENIVFTIPFLLRAGVITGTVDSCGGYTT